MTYVNHYLLQFGGTLGNDETEIWSSGIRMWTDDFTGYDEEDHFDNIIVPALSDWYARTTSHISALSQLTFAKYNLIGADGHYVEPNVREHVYSPIVNGGSAATKPLPFQCSLVVGFRSNEASRGLASRGRMFQPAPQVTMDGNTGLFATAEALEVATSAATLLNTLDISLGIHPMRAHIMSNQDEAHHQIDWCYVDNVIDTQRRRRNALVGVTSKVQVTY